MPNNEVHSAEWLRGAVEALGEATGARVDDCWEPKMSHQQQVARWDHYRTLLAAAEAREGGEKLTDCDWCAGSGDGELDADARQINPCEKCEGRGRHRKPTQPTALPAVAIGGTVMAGNTNDVPTAAEVVVAFVAAWRHVLCGCRYGTPDIAKGEGPKLLYQCQPCAALALAEKWRANQLG